MDVISNMTNVSFLEDIFRLDFVPLIVVIFLWIFIHYNSPYDGKILLLFKHAIVFVLLLIVIDNIDMYNNYFHVDSFLHHTSTILGYNLRLWILVSLINVVLRYNAVTVSRRIILAMPSVITFCVSIASYFSRVMFWYDEFGNFHRGVLSFVPHIAAGVYVVYLVYKAIPFLKTRARQDEALIVIISVFLLSFGVAVESIFYMKGILLGMISIVLIFYYLQLYIAKFKKDELTGVYNKASFNADIRKYSDKITALVSIDVNDLKLVNDNKGHLAGDDALRTIASVINKHLMKGCELYRVGGDEFFIICLGTEEAPLRAMLATMRNAVIEAKYSISSGYAMCEDGKDLIEISREADERMYSEKNLIKQRRKFIPL